MSDPLRFCCEVTPERVARAEPLLAEILWWGNERAYAARAGVRQRLLPALRWTGIALSLLGVVVADAAIVLTPDTACTRGAIWRYYAVIPFFVVGGTLFWFLPRITPALREWTRRLFARAAVRLLAEARRRAPYAAEYSVSDARIDAKVEWLAKAVTTELRSVRSAVVAAELAGLFRRPGGRGLVRVVHLPDPAARAAVSDALRAAGVEVVELARGD